MFSPNLEELRYNFDLNYAADCVFVGLPRVPSSSFHSVNYGDWEYFKAFTNDSLRWHYPTAIVIVSLPALLFYALRGSVLRRLSEERQLTIRIEDDPVTHYSADRYYYYLNSDHKAVSAYDMVWLWKSCLTSVAYIPIFTPASHQ